MKKLLITLLCIGFVPTNIFAIKIINNTDQTMQAKLYYQKFKTNESCPESKNETGETQWVKIQAKRPYIDNYYEPFRLANPCVRFTKIQWKSTAPELPHIHTQKIPANTKTLTVHAIEKHRTKYQWDNKKIKTMKAKK